MRSSGIRPHRRPHPGVSRSTMREAVWAAAVATATGLLACLLTRALIPILARREILDLPNERSSHRVPTPRGGGVAVIGSLLLAWIVLAGIGPVAAGVFGIALGAILLGAVSWFYDLRIPLRLARLLGSAVWLSIAPACL